MIEPISVQEIDDMVNGRRSRITQRTNGNLEMLCGDNSLGMLEDSGRAKSEELTLLETGMLTDCEEVIEQGMETFFEVGDALLKIRDCRLYRESHATFDEYCRDRWGIRVAQ